MADFSTLIASIEATIKQNGVQAITGQVLQDEMLLMVSAINQLKQDTLEGYSFGGGALASGASVSVTQNTFWLAGPGTYTINGESVTITAKGVSVIVYDSVGDDITTATLFAYDATPTAGSDNAPTSGGVAAALADKADREGSAPDLLAGFAGNLVDTRSNGTPQNFIFRQSGGDGVNYLKRIKGKTIVWNQLVQNGNFAEDANWSVIPGATKTISGGTLKVDQTGAGDVGCFQFLPNSINGHKMYYAFEVVAITTQMYCGIARGDASNPMLSNIATQLITNTGRKSFVVTPNLGTYSKFGFVFSRGGAGTSITVKNVICVDLTALGLGDLTAAQFEALYPEVFYAYNAGILKNNAATALVTRGFNQWDEEVVDGAFDTNTGAFVPSATAYLSGKNLIRVIGGQYYYAHFGATANESYFFWFDASGNYLGATSAIRGQIKQAPENAAFAGISWSKGGYGTTYNHDININLSDASRNGTYEPYWTRTLPLNLSGVTGIPEGGTEEDRVTIFPDGLAGVGTAQDVFYEEGGETKARVVMAKVNLGSFTDWFNTGVDGAASPANARMRSYAVSDIIKKVSANNVVANIICARLMKDTADHTYNHDSDKIIAVGTGGDLYVYDSNYASDTGAQFATAMDGVYAIFELATPIVYTNLKNADNTPFTMPKMVEVDEDGTEEATYPADTTPFAPFECDSNYSVSIANLVRKLAE